ncbi:MAG: fumarylacetoacetase [Comamonas sp. SCN 67-35]|mgnify:FL=1|uniref:fumarylacetoacetase n=1 Tax=unclassified Comamonas TaxID=2638500 RepID=UPI00086D157C|nr:MULTISPECIES: fumarylacetoacetase [unclassified Comamonas]MBN9330011.1 fumarylacetoacetase [Comamonas sp.]ODU39573.1 MAG: fumarylacetoacetase [Comamonas sp. SCN 67-35]OJW99779.1 MAG: fumarylacetoacetase [Burkholderiales bacterium 66-26]
MTRLDATHDPSRRSWLASANVATCDFPVQNLPYAVLRPRASHGPFRGAVAIGDQALDLAALAATGLVTGSAADALALAAEPTLNAFMGAGPAAWQPLRRALFALLAQGAHAQDTVRACLLPLADVQYAVPARIGDYTDFYTSLDHARNCMRIMYPDADVTPNFRWLPQAYHGRVSTIGVSGQRFHRPHGQFVPRGASAPVFAPCAAMDYECELGVWVGPGNAAGEPIGLADAEQHLFGICLLNDWSARDIQVWEMQPLGPFHAKNFATTVSPWIVTMDALAPYRRPWSRAADDVQPLPYLDAPANRAQGAIDIQLEVLLHSAQAQEAGRAPARLSGTSFRHQYWTAAQMLAHHAAGGCSLQPADLIGTGTISGPTDGEAGALIELARGGQRPVDIGGGEQRGFLADGDTVILRGWCEQPGAARIGFGECRGTVLPAMAPAGAR